ncbi:MAG: hypothetical protein NZ959_04725 [Armatimonadetes bacterium]|nr:hypothetical protein [Armatimonadota bacterium]MDW8120877.1 hypothetical protein [Armatimonadota bacterium]
MRRIVVGLIFLASTWVWSGESNFRAPDLWVAAAPFSSPDEVPLYKAAGMTVGWITVRLRSDDDLSVQKSLADAFEREGLPFVVALDLRPPPSLVGPSFLPCAAHQPVYVQWLTAHLNNILPAFSKRKGLIGYALGEGADEAASYDDAGFQIFLQSRYGSLENLSSAWAVPVSNWSFVTQSFAEAADDPISPIRYGRPSLDAAAYRYSVLRNLFLLWAQEVRRRDPDPNHLLIAGPLTTYRSLAAVPPVYDVVLPFLSPDRAEWDLETHNAHAVSIARRGGRFQCWVGLTVRGEDGSLVSPHQLRQWMGAAAVQGACGFFFNDWLSFTDHPSLPTTVAAAVASLRRLRSFPLQPRPTTAILYTPFGEGLIDRNNFPLYGFAVSSGTSSGYPRRLSLTEPVPLFSALRFHPWGITDCVTPEELTADRLSRYGVLFAPMAVDLPPSAQEVLSDFVAKGGVVVADFGLAAYQSEEPFLSLPPLLQSLFGVVTLRRVIMDENLRVNMVVLTRHELFPDIPEGSELGHPIGAFPYIVGLTPSFTAQPWSVLSTARFAKRGKRAGRLEMAAVFINRFGKGYALLAPTLLWAIWMPGQPGFDLFHGSLIARRTRIRLQPPVTPPFVWFAETDDGLFVFNPSLEPKEVRFLSVSSPFWAYSEAMTAPVKGFRSHQQIATLVKGQEWVYLRKVALIDPPVPAAVTAAEDRLMINLSPADPLQVTIRIFPGPYPAGYEVHKVTILSKGQETVEKVPASASGILTLSSIPVPSTVLIQPEGHRLRSTGAEGKGP